MPGPTNSLLTTVYAKDEDIAVACGPDFATLVPHDQLLASGTDGVFGNANQWQLTSASNDFATQGVAVGNVIRITGPSSANSAWKGNGSKYAVSAVSTNTLTLRNLGQPDNVGLPPGPSAGATGVKFVIATFGPQIEDVSYWLNSRWGIDPAFQQISPDQVYDLRQLNRACVLDVVVRALTNATRTKDGDFARKLDRFANDLADINAILQIRWNQINENPPPSTRFSCRLSR
ncbi:MAG: hypothetical protein KGR26_14785 [Cyanobacteria bacterium REEB65]|nr:hypothetical protein [Cyanobacteria bacterium REEB65]